MIALHPSSASSRVTSIGQGLLALLLVGVGSSLATAQASETTAAHPQKTRMAGSSAALHSPTRKPVAPCFIANLGQWYPSIDWAAVGSGQCATLSGSCLTLSLADDTQGRSAAVRVQFGRNNAVIRARGTRAAPGVQHFFLGADSTRWRTHVPGYTELLLEKIEPGVDVRLYFQAGILRFDVIVAPGVALTSLPIHVEGDTGRAIRHDGSLELETEAGAFTMSPPRAWECGPGLSRRSVDVTYVMGDAGWLHVSVSRRDPALGLVVDPALEWSTYFGGWTFDGLEHAAVTGDGDVVVAGWTQSPDVPATAGAFDTSFDPGGAPFAGDMVVARFSQTGDLEWATFVGGNNNDLAKGVFGTNIGDDVIVGGWSGSTDYPTTAGAFQKTDPGPASGVVTRLTPTGDALVYSSFVGGSHSDIVNGMALTPEDDVVLVGDTLSADFPTTAGAYQPIPGSLAPTDDGFVTVLDESGAFLVGSTYFGGASGEFLRATAAGPDGSVHVVGTTGSPGFPVTTPGAYNQNGNQPFIVRFSPDLSRPIFSTFMFPSNETVQAMAVDAAGDVVLVGYVSDGLPVTPGAYQPSFAGIFDGFICKLDALGTSLLACTYLGGSEIDWIDAVHVDSAGIVTTASFTLSDDHPTTSGAYKVGDIGGDIAVARLSPDLTELWYATGLGGSDQEPPLESGPLGVAVDGEGAAIVVSETESTDFPMTPGAFDPTFNGGFSDGVVAKLSMLPAGVVKFGASTAGCNGLLPMGVMAQPQVGSMAFGITCTNAEPFAGGWLVVGAGSLLAPVTMKGAGVWVDPLLLVLPVVANDRGALLLKAPLPGDATLVGQSAFVQAFWSELCSSTPKLAASNGLQITFVP